MGIGMALAEAVGVGSRDVHEFGMAALLHDLGMARVPKELLAKPTDIGVQGAELVDLHTAQNTPLKCLAFVTAEVMADLIAGRQGYCGLKWRLLRTLEWQLAWEALTRRPASAKATAVR